MAERQLLLSCPVVAISTARSRAAIGIVRLSGIDLLPMASHLFLPKVQDRRWDDRRPHLATLLDRDGHPIDEGMVLYFKGPNSYTGEDMLELHAHGNPIILEAVVDAACHAGARVALPGEFTRRAFLNGKLDLMQAEAVGQVIEADSLLASSIARRVLMGELSEVVSTVREAVLKALRDLEVHIDFPEESGFVRATGEMLRELELANRALGQIILDVRSISLARRGLRLVLCGRPNVGKSSLLNALLGFKRAIVSDIPGTTRDLIEETVEWEGVRISLRDTAGLRDGPDPLEQQGVSMARQAIADADVVLYVVDQTQAAEEEEWSAELEPLGPQCIRLLLTNKSDLPRHPSFSAFLAEGRTDPDVSSWRGLPVISTSALTGQGLLALRRHIGAHLRREGLDGRLVVTSAWQREVFLRVRSRLTAASEALRSGLLPESAAYDLYDALSLLDELSGGASSEEVLDRVFQEFCVGK